MDELLSGSLGEAVEKLAELAAATRAGLVEKVAAGDFLASLGEAVRTNPAISHALIGGGLGAAALGAGTAYSNLGKEPERKRSVLGSALTGGLMGAGAGAGVGAARSGLAALKGTAPGLGTDALRPGEYEVPGPDGRPTRMRIDPQALKDNPDLHSQVRSLTTPTLQSQLSGGAAGVYDFLRTHTPVSATLAPIVGAADAVLHAPVVGMARTTADRVGGELGRKFLDLGLSELPDDRAPAQMRAAVAANSRPGTAGGVDVKSHVGNQAGGGWFQRLRNRVTGATGPGVEPGLLDRIGRHAGTGEGNRVLAEIAYPQTVAEKQVVHPTNPDGTLDRTRSQAREVHVPTGETVREQFTEGQAGSAKLRGAAKHEYFKDRSIFRVPGTNRHYGGFRSLGGAAGARLAGYGLPFAGEYLVRGLQEDATNRQSLRDLMARYAREVPRQEGR